MPTPRLTRILCRFFNLLFYGELIVFFVCLPTFVFIHSFYPDLLFGGIGGSSSNQTVAITKMKTDSVPVPVGEVGSADRQSDVKLPPVSRRTGGEDAFRRFSFFLKARGGLFPKIGERTSTSWAFHEEWQSTLKTPPALSLTTKPDIRLARSVASSPEFSLQFSYNNWHEFSSLPWPALVLLLGNLLFFLVFTLAITYRFKRLFDGLSQQDYFGPEQIRRLNQTGWLFLMYGLFQYISYLATGRFVRSLLEQHQIGMNFQVVIGWPVGGNTLLTGAVILVLAQIFTYGQQLKQEQDLTI